MKKLLTGMVMAALMALLQGCATVGSASNVVYISIPFERDLAAAMMMPGPNTITGSAVVRQRGGGVVTCAGSTVRLVPVTQYSRYRMKTIYGSARMAATQPDIRPFVPEYAELTKTTTCNAQGFFTFNGVADGEFFVVTEVRWSVGYSSQGGSLYERVSVKGGERFELTLTP